MISAAGNLDFDVLVDKCRKYFVFPPGPKALQALPPSSAYRARSRSVKASGEQLHLLLGFEGLSFQDPYRFDALILSFFLGGGMSSRLFQEIREVAALAYSVDADCIAFMDTGVFTFYIGMAPKSLKESLKILSREIENLKKVPLSKSALDRVKSQLKGTILLSSDQTEVRQESLGRNEIVFGRYVPVEEVIQEIERTSPERIQALAQRLFVPEKESVVVSGAIKSKEPLLAFFDETLRGCLKVWRVRVYVSHHDPIQKIHPQAQVPAYMSPGAAGCDVFACLENALEIAPGKRAAVSTGLSIEIPDGFEVQVRPRSGLAWKKGLTVINAPGTIDSDYRGK